ncbi:hypothetical protein H2198_005319 [Neophaeococcomyces mojaviensis]|uniref:Uncharacterized protein n=1 Tax=Neophaeococcomyces mojaviensis TaxID=3383035 RepID=A0ACC3A6P1_9EURO|nr:hypothetical protein H2198_005319 [Knufia sp. JES_112]
MMHSYHLAPNGLLGAVEYLQYGREFMSLQPGMPQLWTSTKIFGKKRKDIATVNVPSYIRDILKKKGDTQSIVVRPIVEADKSILQFADPKWFQTLKDAVLDMFEADVREIYGGSTVKVFPVYGNRLARVPDKGSTRTSVQFTATGVAVPIEEFLRRAPEPVPQLDRPNIPARRSAPIIMHGQ